MPDAFPLTNLSGGGIAPRGQEFTIGKSAKTPMIASRPSVAMIDRSSYLDDPGEKARDGKEAGRVPCPLSDTGQRAESADELLASPMPVFHQPVRPSFTMPCTYIGKLAALSRPCDGVYR